MTDVTPSDLALQALMVAKEAGQMLKEFRNQPSNMGILPGELGRRADLAADALLRQKLCEYPYVSEHTQPQPSTWPTGRFWLVDPLDGTNEYAQGLNEYAVHVALMDGDSVVAAAVYCPEISSPELKGHPENKHWAPMHALGGVQHLNWGRPWEKRLVLTSRSRPATSAFQVAKALRADVQTFGSVGYKVVSVVEYYALAYIHEGDLNAWDVAAPAKLAESRGLCVTDLRGRPLRFNQPDLKLRDGLIVCWPADLQTILHAVSAARGSCNDVHGGARASCGAPA
ncbi:MAG: hypothetical protein NZ533_08170 [Casimicrobiaceae bacterium]|nr:hypothetical protein [Casimicrobiaceae bacterium]